VADRAADDAGRREASLAADLRAAVAAGALVAHFQPQLDAATGDLAGVEALVRWPHPELGLLGPERFLGLAEALGLMGGLTRLVLHQALAQVAPLRGGAPARVSVNVSASSLLDPDLATDVAAALLEHGVAPEELVLEITESELMQDAGECLRVVHALVELGVGVSIDDYGTGHSSLAYLRYLPAVELKLDRSFADDLCRDERLADIVRTTIDLAHTLGMRLVAEGVEDEETLVRLRELGADVTQGHHHAAPVPGPELTAWVAAHRARRAAARAAAPVEAPAG
jgi:EAL domain-containing protein (putative c-di-GMP-specific phosphodiesterase class I)